MTYNELYYSKGSNGAEVKLTDLTLHRDDAGYYLSAKYGVEDQYSVREINIPNIRLCVKPDQVVIRHVGELYPCVQVDIGFGWLTLYENEPVDGVYFTETVLEEKTHEMTLAEIEKKLGYKVKIVNK